MRAAGVADLLGHRRDRQVGGSRQRGAAQPHPLDELQRILPKATAKRSANPDRLVPAEAASDFGLWSAARFSSTAAI